MEKTTAEGFHIDDSSEWAFPNVDILVKGEDFLAKVPDAKNAEETEAEHNKIEQAYEIDCLKKEYFRKIALVNQMINKLENLFSILDKESMDLIQHVVKSAIKKIIYKELQVDEKLIHKMIEELCALVPANNGVATVFLSEIDFNKLAEEKVLTENVALKINSSLTEGDVIVKSNVGEIRAILDNRINQILGLKNG